MATKLAAMESKTDAAVRIFAEQGKEKLVGYAKRNAPWTDRTGSARGRLNGYVSKVSNGYRITLAHGVDYGIWLELAHEKRFAILPQTLEVVGNQEIIPAFQLFMEKLR